MLGHPKAQPLQYYSPNNMNVRKQKKELRYVRGEIHLVKNGQSAAKLEVINMKYTKESFQKELERRFPENDITVLDFSGTNKPIKYRCNKCGSIYSRTRACHLYENKTLCTKCYSARESKIRNWIYDFFKNSPNFEMINDWYNTGENIIMKCKKCNNIFEKEPDNLYGKNEETICPFCGRNGAPKDKEYYLRRLEENGFKDYDILKVGRNNHSFTFKHLKCNTVFSKNFSNMVKSRGCPHCFPNISKGEQQIMNFLEENKIDYIYQFHLNSPNELKSYDFFLPKLSVVIEYQGEQHFYPIKGWGGEEKFLKQQNNDKIKREYAKNHNLKLIEIPYYDLKDINKYLLPLKSSTTIPNGSRLQVESKKKQ